MSTTTFKMAAEELDSAQVKNLFRNMADFVAMYEAAEVKLHAREKAIEQRQAAAEEFLNDQLAKIHAALAEFQDEFSEFQTAAGTARLRLATEDMFKKGEQYALSLEATRQDIEKTIQDSCHRLDQASAHAIRGVSESISSFRISDFKQLTLESYQQVEEIAANAIHQITSVVKWFHWKNLGLALGISLVVAVIIGLYVDDEWPWEIHQEVVKQREAGEALLNAWPHLSKPDQEYIRTITKHDLHI